MVLALVVTAVSGITISLRRNVQAAPAFDVYGYVDSTVTASGLNVRQGPSTSYKVVHILYKGQTVKALGKLGDWYVIHDPSTGYVGCVSTKYLTINWPSLLRQRNRQLQPLLHPQPPTTTTPDVSEENRHC